MEIRAFYVLYLYVLIGFVLCNKYTKEGCTKDKHGNEHCLKKDEFEEDDDDDGPMFYGSDDYSEEHEHLFQWDPIKVGYEREIEISEGNKVKMITRALKPKVFVIDDFLSTKETDYIIKKASFHGLATSGLHVSTEMRMEKTYSIGHAKDSLGNMNQWDFDRNGVITIEEIIRAGQENIKLYMNSTDVKEMFKLLKMNELDDGVITVEEFQKMNTVGLGEYMADLREEHPRFRDRFSEQVWLKQNDKSDSTMYNLREKVIKLTNLPRRIVEGGEPLQVLRYQPFGHYHAHFDGQAADENPNKNCCHLDVESQPYDCKLCRFLTIIYYLNDVEEGGETAFPVADKEGYQEETFKQRTGGDLYNLSEFCHNATLVVKPKRGRAVMFYNHFIDKKGWLGEMDKYSLHGGCDIIRGEKWLANNWITAPPAEKAHEESLYRLIEPFGAF